MIYYTSRKVQISCIAPNTISIFFPAFRWIERVPEISLESVTDRKDNDIAKRLLSIDYNAEIIWLRYVKLTILVEYKKHKMF